MSSIKTRPDKIARRYGNVLFAMASKNKEINAVLTDLNHLQTCIEEEPLQWKQVISPSLPLYTQRRIIESLLASLKLGNLMSRFLIILCLNRRLPYFNLIMEEFLEQMKRAKGILDGILETPIELSRKDVEILEKSLNVQLGKIVHLHQVIKESLLGGVVLRIESLMIDGSTRTYLNKLKTAMKG